MGAEQFQVHWRKEGEQTVEQAHASAVAQAQYEHGHGGYSGTLAEKHEVELYDERVMSLADAQMIADRVLSHLGSAHGVRCVDKWGPTCAIAVVDDADGHPGWLFFGYASS